MTDLRISDNSSSHRITRIEVFFSPTTGEKMICARLCVETGIIPRDRAKLALYDLVEDILDKAYPKSYRESQVEIAQRMMAEIARKSKLLEGK